MCLSMEGIGIHNGFGLTTTKKSINYPIKQRDSQTLIFTVLPVPYVLHVPVLSA